MKNEFTGNSLRILLFASLAGTMSIGMPAVAADVMAPIPTLDEMHSNQVELPEIGQEYPDSAYTLEQTQVQNSNLIISAINRETGAKEPTYYNLSLKDAVLNYGTGDGNYTTNIDIVGDNFNFNGQVNVNYDNVSADSKYENGDEGVSVESNFIGFTSSSALSNQGTIDSVKGDFINNEISATKSNASGAAVSNYSTGRDEVVEIKKISGNFVGNRIYADRNASGAAIYNDANYSENKSTIIGDIEGNFIENSVVGSMDASNSVYSASGGAIYNMKQINSINGNFVKNSSVAQNVGRASGGAINNNGNGNIGSIKGHFIANNAVVSEGYEVSGGAIANYSNIDSIVGDFIGNYVFSENVDCDMLGGAIFNQGIINNIKGDFIGNSANAQYESERALGGAIFNSFMINDISGNFIDNTAYSGGAIYNAFGTANGAYYGSPSIDNAIYSNVSESYFYGNNAAFGGAVSLDSKYYNDNPFEGTFSMALNIENSVFENNTAESGGAIVFIRI